MSPLIRKQAKQETRNQKKKKKKKEVLKMLKQLTYQSARKILRINLQERF